MEKAPFLDVLAWMERHPDATKKEAAEEHGWVPDTLYKALKRHEKRYGKPVQSGGAAKTKLPADVRAIIKTGMLRRLQYLATGDSADHLSAAW